MIIKFKKCRKNGLNMNTKKHETYYLMFEFD